MPSTVVTQSPVLIGVDVGGTFTDLVALDGGECRVIKVPSSVGQFESAVVEAVRIAMGGRDTGRFKVVHGSTVATNALLQRAGEPIALLTTEGFADILHIGRQNRRELYALNPSRPASLTDHCFEVHERIDARGEVITPVDEARLALTIDAIKALGLKHVAVCLLFNFINPAHEQQVGETCRRAGLTVTLSSDLVPEFREYERASTTAINAALRPLVESYLSKLESGLVAEHGERLMDLRILHSRGGTLTCEEAWRQAARLVLSGPAGGVLGATYIANMAGYQNVITCDMGGTSTDVALVVNGQPQWTSSAVIDGLPIALPMFDIHTVGAGGGSVAYVDGGGALRVGPRSAGAVPGPACYGRGGDEPTVTDANVVLGRIAPARFLGGRMSISIDRARQVIAPLAKTLGKTEDEIANGILKVVEANMERAIRAVTTRKGYDPRDFALVAFGGAGGLHACALADALGIRTVIIPAYAGVLSALGMAVAAPVVEASKTVLQLGDALDDEQLPAEFGFLSGKTIDAIPYEQTSAVEAWAHVRFKGQAHELAVRIGRPTLEEIADKFREAYRQTYGHLPEGRPIEIVSLRVRRIGHMAQPRLPEMVYQTDMPVKSDSGELSRAELLNSGSRKGPFLLIDEQATSFIARGWVASADRFGIVTICREEGAL